MFTASENSSTSVPEPRSRLKLRSSGLLSSPVKFSTWRVTLFTFNPARSWIASEVIMRKVLFSLVAKFMMPRIPFRSTGERLNSITLLIVVSVGPVVRPRVSDGDSNAFWKTMAVYSSVEASTISSKLRDSRPASRSKLKEIRFGLVRSGNRVVTCRTKVLLNMLLEVSSIAP